MSYSAPLAWTGTRSSANWAVVEVGNHSVMRRAAKDYLILIPLHHIVVSPEPGVVQDKERGKARVVSRSIYNTVGHACYQ